MRVVLAESTNAWELRSRTERLCKFEAVDEVESELANLMARDEPLVVKLDREPGKSRIPFYSHLFSDIYPSSTVLVTESEGIATEATYQERINELEQQV